MNKWSYCQYVVAQSFYIALRGQPERMGPVPHPGTIISSILSTSLGSKTLNTSSLGLGGTKIKDPVVGAIWPGYFTSPLGAFRRDAPAHSRVRRPNNGKVGIKSFARTPGALGLMAFLSSQPHPHQSSSSTQFSQEWVQKGWLYNLVLRWMLLVFKGNSCPRTGWRVQ